MFPEPPYDPGEQWAHLPDKNTRQVLDELHRDVDDLDTEARGERRRPSRPSTASGRPESVSIAYVNYRGERSVRRIDPIGVRWGASEYHPEPQWLLDAFDREKAAERTFAMRDILAWDVG